MWFRNAFGPGKHDVDPAATLTEKELTVFDELAREIVRLKMVVPAIMFLESVKPANWIGAQGMIVGEPLVQPVLAYLGHLFPFTRIVGNNYNTLQAAFEKRESLEILIQKIEEYDAMEYRKERELKKKKGEKKKGLMAIFKRKKGGDKV
jgi:hypothetical protein